MEKKHFWYNSRFWVALFSVIVMLSIGVESIPFIAAKYGLTLKAVELPIDVIGWSWTALLSIYIGTDRLEKIISSKEIPYGEIFMGDLAKLRRMILLALFIYLEALAMNAFFGADLSLSSFFMAFSASLLLYVGGNKAIKTMGNVDGANKVDDTGDSNKIMDSK